MTKLVAKARELVELDNGTQVAGTHLVRVLVGIEEVDNEVAAPEAKQRSAQWVSLRQIRNIRGFLKTYKVDR